MEPSYNDCQSIELVALNINYNESIANNKLVGAIWNLYDTESFKKVK